MCWNLLSNTLLRMRTNGTYDSIKTHNYPMEYQSFGDMVMFEYYNVAIIVGALPLCKLDNVFFFYLFLKQM